jgi:membrane-associated phospholipid phosphatase
MLAASILGSWPAYLSVFVAAALTAKLGEPRIALIVLGSFGLAQLVRLAANLTFRRTRPPLVNQLMKARFHSFPSGHTAAAALGYGLTALLTSLMDPAAGAVIAAFAALATILVATSRTYLGVHWLTDVVASIAYSTAWILITMIVIQQ